ncbi:pentapeptide repeat-containing protein [Shinella zoogloeoides]|uniref:Pentapeptide repeat-containing protein n=1 Tax=Shinella zoogloeoides TaxID=352475 RepID=A0A6N8TG06_SHIZO|nr:pentapeptide repeat-containing protein [Shinella zoogloeoides]MXO02172.1 pentapeptide repeat-containing protein [Shinella zoogloeoides]UEX83848.1 pentapeptide repeat-containing protein [Shinella zoogloeoides]
MAERRYGEPAPPITETIAGADWYGRELEREHHESTLFSDLDFTDGRNVGSVFNACTFRRVRFSASVHESAAFVNCTFISCNFFDSILTECKFVGSMFDRCAFDNMKVVNGDWSFTGLPGADLRRATFSGTRLRETDLTGAICEGGSIRDADLSGAWLHGADFSRCDLRGSDLTAIEPENVKLKEAIITIDQTIVIAEALGFDVRRK